MGSQPKQWDVLLPIVCYHDSISCCQCVRPIICGSFETSSARSFISSNGAFNSTELCQMPPIEPVHSDDLDQMPVLKPRYECILPSIVFLVSFWLPPYYRAFVNFYFGLTASCPIFWPVLLSFLFPYQASIHRKLRNATGTVTTKSIMSIYLYVFQHIKFHCHSLSCADKLAYSLIVHFWCCGFQTSGIDEGYRHGTRRKKPSKSSFSEKKFYLLFCVT